MIVFLVERHRSRGMSPFTKGQIATLLFVEGKDDIEVTIPPVQQQSN